MALLFAGRPRTRAPPEPATALPFGVRRFGPAHRLAGGYGGVSLRTRRATGSGSSRVGRCPPHGDSSERSPGRKHDRCYACTTRRADLSYTLPRTLFRNGVGRACARAAEGCRAVADRRVAARRRAVFAPRSPDKRFTFTASAPATKPPPTPIGKRVLTLWRLVWVSAAAGSWYRAAPKAR